MVSLRQLTRTDMTKKAKVQQKVRSPEELLTQCAWDIGTFIETRVGQLESQLEREQGVFLFDEEDYVDSLALKTMVAVHERNLGDFATAMLGNRRRFFSCTVALDTIQRSGILEFAKQAPRSGVLNNG